MRPFLLLSSRAEDVAAHLGTGTRRVYLSIREAARLQGFPDRFQILGDRTSQYDRGRTANEVWGNPPRVRISHPPQIFEKGF